VYIEKEEKYPSGDGIIKFSFCFFLRFGDICLQLRYLIAGGIGHVCHLDFGVRSFTWSVTSGSLSSSAVITKAFRCAAEKKKKKKV